MAAAQHAVAPSLAQSALAELCRAYWPPVYGFVRGSGYSEHDAQDLTQGFFCHLIEQQIYMRADPARGKFRTFLLTSVKNYLANAYHRQQTLKRGGGYEFLPWDEAQVQAAETLYQNSVTPGIETSADALFEREWAETLIENALAALATEFEDDGKGALFRELRVFLQGSAEPLPSSEELGARLSMRATAVRTQISRLRVRYRERLRAELRQTVDTEEAVDGELRELLRVLTAA